MESHDQVPPPDRNAEPKDRLNIVYIIFYVLGIGSLLPWNFFITAKDYFEFKLRNTSVPEKDYKDTRFQTEYQLIFESSIAVASMVPNLIFNFVTALCTQRLPLKFRMTVSTMIVLIMFILTVIFAKDKNTIHWQSGFYAFTIVSVVILNACSSVFTTSLFGLAGVLPHRYMQASMSGQAVGGIFAAVANLITIAVGTDVSESAFIFFLIATGWTLITMLGYLSLYSNEFSRYYLNKQANKATETVTVGGDKSVNNSYSYEDENEKEPLIKDDVISESVELKPFSYHHDVFKKIWVEGISVCLVFLVTLACFPALASSIQSCNSGDWRLKYFTPVICFLLYNVGDWTGRSFTGIVHFPRPNQTKLMLTLSVIRFVFIPLLMFCNVMPRHNTTLVFSSDMYPLVFIILLGISNGYLSTLCVMYGPKKVFPQYAEFTGATMSVCMTVGLALGSLFGLLLVKIV
ncbi:equilibrative nucleoside transporter 3-like isoform X2 [Mytilus californianus]|uniref:equilibrative nucleoside transporter 3-like isoform X1 n=1 Tax=Mytilus californianus TaxID=6549 RepID=UPI0022467BDB|nr:equilibrative nucleoside transporter 3-like isoform X1 [Mytilus californianus]XP_052106844.1 equilibrative nucleoside transporter 3-like isoform X2 [Mytilus californianus]